MRRPGLWISLVALGVGSVLLAAGCGSSNSTSSSSPGGGVVPHQNGGTIKAVIHGDIDYIDPALGYYQTGWQIEYSTCVKLLNYPDKAGDAGKQLVPEAASGLPVVSSDGLTYTFTVPAGKYKFNTGEPVTAATFQYVLERDLNPKQASFFGSFFLGPYIAGASTFKGNPGEHMSGVTVQGDKLIIKLSKPNGTLVPELATPFACAVPMSTPIDSKGVKTIAGAGPYYISSWSQHRSLVLKKNPNYTGDRTAYADEIDFSQMTIDQNQGTLELKNGTVDYCPDCVPGAQTFQLNQQFGPGSPSATSGDQRFFVTSTAIIQYLAMNTTRDTFKNPLVRQAVNYAIDRPALLKPSGYGAGVVGEKYIPSSIAGAQDEDAIYPLNGPDLAKAQDLMNQAKAQGVKTPLTAVVYSTADTQSATERMAVLQQNLAKIGITVKPKYFTRGLQFQKEGTKGEPVDISDEGWVQDFPDPYDFINVLLNGENIPPTGGNNFSYFNDQASNVAMDHAATLTGDARAKAYGALATDISKNLAPWALWSYGTNIDFFGSKIGCTVDTPSYGMDYGTMCLRK
jgi:ABC-type transport system substrate-binding protein